jgi:hypothetical protein
MRFYGRKKGKDHNRGVLDTLMTILSGQASFPDIEGVRYKRAAGTYPKAAQT